MFLSHEEVCELTGAHQKAGQLENLRRNGIRHTIKRNGWPSVTKAAIVQGAPDHTEPPVWKPKKAS